MHAHARRTVFNGIKIGLALAILGYLVYKARDAFLQLTHETTEWRFLAGGLLFTLAMATLSFVRWHLLIRAQGIDIRLVDTLRLGALGFALNFVSPGAIGGDFFKAMFLAHGQPGRRTEAVATVVADRIIGLLTMMLLASVGILVTGLLYTGSTDLKVLCRTILLATLVTWIGFLLILFVRALTGGWLRRMAGYLRYSGSTIIRLLDAVDVYRGRKPALLAAFGVSLAMALCFVTSFYMVARALPIQRPTWSQHLVIVPVAGLAGAIPLTPSGLGIMEYAVTEMYKVMPGGSELRSNDCTMVGIGRRLNDIVVAVVGLVFYLRHRREVDEVFVEAEEAADAE
jgi:uncharacterized protein (TIRG00374 family)